MGKEPAGMSTISSRSFSSAKVAGMVTLDGSIVLSAGRGERQAKKPPVRRTKQAASICRNCILEGSEVVKGFWIILIKLDLRISNSDKCIAGRSGLKPRIHRA
jgi:hypothetical protein